MARDFTLRTFRFPDDYEAVYRLWSNAGPGIQLRKSDEPEEIEKKLKRDPDLFLVAEAEGRIIGAVLGGFDGRRGIMYHLAVAPEYRGRGVGDALMRALEARWRAKGCLRYYLLVTPDNEEAICFYEKRGCERMDLYVYGKDIA